MEHVNGGYAYYQLTGEAHEGVNQHRNINPLGVAKGFCADIYDERGRAFLTTMTRGTLQEVDADIDRWIVGMERAPIIVPMNEEHNRRLRGIVE